MRQLLRVLPFVGAMVSGLYGQAGVAISAEVGRDLIPIQNGDITSGDPGQFFGVVDGGVVNGETSSSVIRYQLKNTGDELLRIDLERIFITSSDFRLLGVPGPENRVWTVQPNETKNFSIEYVPSVQSSGGIFELRNVQSAGVEPIIFQFAVSGRGNLGEPEVFHVLNDIERDIPNGDTTPTFNKGTNFGDVLVGETVANNLRVRHAGTSGDTLKITGATIIGIDRDSFSVVNLNAILNDGQEKGFNIGFTPQSPGEKNAKVRFNTNDPDNSTFTFDLRGNGEPEQGILVEGRYGSTGPFRLIADGAAVNAGAGNGTFFPSTFEGNSATNTYRITNTGDGELTLSGGGVGGDDFSASPLPASLAPGETADFSITFAPTDQGSFTKTYAFFTNIPGDLGLFSFSLSGQGLGPEGAETTVEREGLDGEFSEASNNIWTTQTSFEGDTELSPIYRIRNTGNQVLTVSNITLSGEGAEQVTLEGLSFPVVIGVGAVSPDFQLSFTATIPDIDPRTLDVDFIAGGASKSHLMRISRVLAASTMEVSGKPVGDSFFPIGSGGVPQLANGTAFPVIEGGGPVVSTFRITNTHGSEGLLFGAPEITGAHAADFAIDGFSTATLLPGESQEFTLTFESAEPTERNATLSFRSNDLNIRTFEINLLGNAPEVEDLPPLIHRIEITGLDVEFSVATSPGKKYRLRRSSSLARLWEDVPGVPLIDGSTAIQVISVPDLIDPRVARYFYRIEELE